MYDLLKTSLDLMSSGHKNKLLKIKEEAESVINRHVAVFMAELRDANPDMDFDFWTKDERIEMYDPQDPHFNGCGDTPDPTIFILPGREQQSNDATVMRCQEFIDILNNTMQEYADNGMFLELNSNYLPYGRRDLLSGE